MQEAADIAELPPGRAAAQLSTTALVRYSRPVVRIEEEFPRPQHSKFLAIFFNVLWPIAALANLVAAVPAYALSSNGAILPGFYQSFSSIDPTFYLWVEAGIALGAVLVTSLAYSFTLDFRRQSRPRWRLYILFSSFCVYLAAALLGALKVLPDQVWAFLVALTVALLVPLLLLIAEELFGAFLAHTAAQLLENNSPGAAKTLSRAALRFCPAHLEAERTYGLSLVRTGRAEGALPYLVRESGDLATLPAPVLSALVDAFEAYDRSAESLAVLEALHRIQPTKATFERLIRRWLAAGRKEDVLRELQALQPKERLKWHDTLTELVFETGELEKARGYCREVEINEGAPYTRARECYTRLLQLYPDDLQLNRAVIELSRRRGEAQYSAELLEKVIEMDPERSVDDRRTLTSYYWTTGDRESMLRHLKHIYASSKATLQEKLQIAEEYFSSAEYEQLERFVNGDAQLQFNTRALGTLAHALFEQKRLDESLSVIEKVRQLETENGLTVDLQKLQAEIQQTTLKSEIESLQNQRSENPHDLDAFFALCQRVVRSGDTQSAISQLKELLERDPKQSSRVKREVAELLSRTGEDRLLLEFLGDLHLSDNEVDAAFSAYSRASQKQTDSSAYLAHYLDKVLDVDPGYKPAIIAQARRAIEQKDPAAALGYLDKFSSANGQIDTPLREIEFEAASSARDLPRALAAGRQLLRSGKSDPGFFVRMSEIATELGDFDEAATHLETARQLEPTNELYETLLRVLARKRKRSRIADLEEQITAGNSTPDQHEELGDLQQDLGEFAQAMTHYQRAAYGAPERRLARAKLAYVFSRRGLHQEADETLQETDLSLEIAPPELDRLKELFYHVAELMEKDDESSRALGVFRRVLKVEAGYRDVVAHVERLQRLERKRTPLG